MLLQVVFAAQTSASKHLYRTTVKNILFCATIPTIPLIPSIPSQSGWIQVIQAGLAPGNQEAFKGLAAGGAKHELDKLS